MEAPEVKMAQAMYDAYCDKANWPRFNCRPMRPWEELGAERQAAWCAAAGVAMQGSNPILYQGGAIQFGCAHRDEFAMAAANGLLSNSTWDGSTKALATLAYAIADSMMAARDVKGSADV